MIRSFLYKISLLLLPVALLVSAINFFIDPANLFAPKKYVEGVASILLNGSNVDNISNYDERLLQEELVTRRKYTADIVILGSSRIMEIGADFFPGQKVWNLGVSHANINDIVALTGLLDSLGKLPPSVIINVDPGLISREATVEWQSIALYYQYGLKQLGDSSERTINIKQFRFLKKYLALFSPEYFRESLSYMVKGASKEYKNIGLDTPKIYGRFADGTVCYSYAYQHPDVNRVGKVAARTAANAKKIEMDEEKKALFLLLIDYLQSKKIDITFVFIPYHAAYYQKINEVQGSIFAGFEEAMRALAVAKKIPVIGSLDPSKAGVRDEDFYDMYHCSKQSIKLFFTKD